MRASAQDNLSNSIEDKKDKHIYGSATREKTGNQSKQMESGILQSLASNSPLSANSVLKKPSAPATIHVQVCLLHRRRLVKVCCTNSNTNNSSGSSTSSSEAESPVPPPITPPETVEIRFKRGSRRRRQLREDGFEDGQRLKMKAAADPAPPKKWEEMSIAEKAIELYMGEKGLLFWLNKFAYASIFIVIGAWMLFRFVGPALNLYELESSPLSPTSMFKGS